MARVSKYIASESGRSSHGLLYGEIRRARKGLRKTDFLASLTWDHRRIVRTSSMLR